MVIAIEDIRDRDNLEAWLRIFPGTEVERRRAAIFIAARAAARVAVSGWNYLEFHSEARNSDLKSLQILRALLTSAVAAEMPTSDIAIAATVVSGEVAATDYHRFAFSDAARDASLAAAYLASEAVRAAASAVRFAAEAVVEERIAYAAIWESIRLDCRELSDGANKEQRFSVNARELWVPRADPYRKLWASLKLKLHSDEGVDWSFWINWYEDLLHGREPNWDLLYEVATSKSINWEASSAEVNTAIGKIVNDYKVQSVIENHALDRAISYDAKTGKLSSHSITQTELSQIVKNLRSALNRFVRNCQKSGGHNALGQVVLSSLSSNIEQLRKEIGQHKQNPSELARCLELRMRSMNRVARDEGVNAAEEFQSLMDDLHYQEEALVVAVPEIMEFRKQRLAMRADVFLIEYRRVSLQMATGMMIDSEGPLQAATAWCLQVLSDPEADNEQQKTAVTFILGALSRGARELYKVGEKGADPSKDNSWGEILNKGADGIIKGDKVIDAVQENIPDATNWTLEVYSQIASGNFFGLGS